MRLAWLLLAAGCNAAFGLGDTALVGDNPRIIVFDNSASSRDLVGLPVLVTLDSTRVDYRQIANPSTDLRFYDPVADQEEPFEIERWDSAGTSLVWTRAPPLPAGSTESELELFYGAEAHGTEDPASLWHDYDLVLHGASFSNAARAAYPAMPASVATVPGPIDLAYGLGETSELDIADSGPLFDGWNQFTLEMFVYADYDNASQVANQPTIVTKSVAFQNGRLFANPNIAQVVELQCDFDFTTFTSTDPIIFPLRQWVHVAWSFDGQTIFIYRDGLIGNAGSGSGSTQLLSDQTPIHFGDMNGNALHGGLDEIRVSHVYRDPDWMNALYLGMTGRLATFLPPGQR